MLQVPLWKKGMGMYEKVESLGFKIGKDELIEDIYGSTWTEKIPKEAVKRLLKQLNLDGKNVLVVGDGRVEISAGVQMGSVMVSRLPKEADYQCKLHKTNIIIDDYLNGDLFDIFE